MARTYLNFDYLSRGNTQKMGTGKNIKEIRLAFDMTQTELGLLVFPQSSVKAVQSKMTRIEQEQQELKTSETMRFAKALSVDVDYLTKGYISEMAALRNPDEAVTKETLATYQAIEAVKKIIASGNKDVESALETILIALQQMVAPEKAVNPKQIDILDNFEERVNLVKKLNHPKQKPDSG